MWVIWLTVCWVSAAAILGCRLYCLKSKKPVNLWSWDIVKIEDVIDISQYNKDNATMWTIYSIPYWVAGIIGMFNILIGVIIVLLACSLGLILLSKYYKRIEKKYLRKYQ